MEGSGSYGMKRAENKDQIVAQKIIFYIRVIAPLYKMETLKCLVDVTPFGIHEFPLIKGGFSQITL